MSDFVHLHVHSDYSLLDGCAKVGRLTKHVAAQGMKAIALTDHGNLFGTISFYEKAKAANIKPIIGCEAYLVADHKNTDKPQRTKAGGDDDYGQRDGIGNLQNRIFHMGLLAQDNAGYHNLVKLISDAHVKGFYYKPRIDMETLAKYSGGLIGLSGCVNGVIPKHLLAGEEAKARQYLDKFLQIFGKDRFIIELQDHGFEEQRRVNPMLLKLAREYGLMAVCTNDSHYVEQSDAIPHDIMLCVQTGAKLSDPDRMRFDVQEFFIKTPQQMGLIFGEEPCLLTNTAAVAERCNVEFNFKKNNYPRYRMTAEEAAKYSTHFDLLKDICVRGLQKRYSVGYDTTSSEPRTKMLSERLDYEIKMIEKMGFVDYFLVVQDFINWSKVHDIPVGPGRGSGAGSLVAYLTSITNIDPIRFKLFFERFLNPERVSPPDFDIDFCMRRREEVVDYVKDRYGAENVGNIITYGTFGAKMVIRDICRVKDVPFAEADRLAKMVPEGVNPKTQHGWELKDAAEIPEFAQELKSNPLAQEIYKHGTIIEGMVRSTGKHAAGIVIAEKPLVEYLPVTLQEGSLTTQFDKNQVEKLGLLKMDFLGLKTLTVIADALAFIHAGPNPTFDLESIPLDDTASFDIITSGRTPAIFQLESGGIQAACRQVGISSIDDINAVVALYRPGPMANIPVYAEGKKDPTKITYPHPLLEEVLRETYGVIVYQEQVMEAAKILAGYSLGGADILRRAMGKKKIEEMDKQRTIFVEGAAKTNNIPKEKAVEIFAILEKFAGYGFNKAHSAAYALIAYQTAYLKAHYPVEFMAGVLGCELGNAENVAKFIAECAAMKIDVLGPDVNESGLNFTPVKGKIRFGLGAIKGVGEGGAGKIIEDRKNNGHFKNFDDFLKRLGNKAVNRRVIENLVKAGAFDACGDERAHLIANLDELIKSADKKDSNQGMLFDMFDMGGQQTTSVEPLPFQVRLQYERELLGFYVTGHPLDEYLHLTEAIDTSDDLRSIEDRKYFRVCGVVSDVVKKFSKKDNQPWALFKFSTQNTTYEMSLFSSAYAKDGALLTDGAVVVLVGQARDQNGEKRFSIESVRPLAPNISSFIKKIVFTLKNEISCLAWLKDIKTELLKTSGEIVLNIGFAAAQDQTLVAALPESLKWRFSTKSYQTLIKSPCVVEVKATATEFVPPVKKWGPNNGSNGFQKKF